jgi:hypothetical protein
VLALLERVKHLLDFTKCIGKLATLLKGVGECFNDGEQRDTILVCVWKLGMRLQLVLKCLGALSEYHVVKTRPEVRVFLFLDPVFFYLKLPHFELNRIGGIRGYWGRQGSQLEVPYSLRELSSVLGVGPTNVVNDLFSCLDVLVRASFAG